MSHRNLGRYAQRFTKKTVLPWEGFCIVHDRITPEMVRKARNAHPDASLLVHPECRPEVINLADHVASTSGLIRQVRSSEEHEFIIGTEVGILHRLGKECPGKRCYPLSDGAVCRNMKKMDLAKVPGHPCDAQSPDHGAGECCYPGAEGDRTDAGTPINKS